MVGDASGGPGITGSLGSKAGNIAEAIAQSIAGIGGTEAGTAGLGGTDQPGGIGAVGTRGAGANDIGLLGSITTEEDVAEQEPTPAATPTGGSINGPTTGPNAEIASPSLSLDATPSGATVSQETQVDVLGTAPETVAPGTTTETAEEAPAAASQTPAAPSIEQQAALSARATPVTAPGLTPANDESVPSTTSINVASQNVNVTDEDDDQGLNTNQQINEVAQEETEDVDATEEDVAAVNQESIDQAVGRAQSLGFSVSPNIGTTLAAPGNVVDGKVTQQGMEALQADISKGGTGRFSVLGGLGGVGMTVEQAISLGSELPGTETSVGDNLLNASTSQLTSQQIQEQVNASFIAGQFSPNAAMAMQAAAFALSTAIGGVPGAIMGLISSPHTHEAITDLADFLADEPGDTEFAGENFTSTGETINTADFFSSPDFSDLSTTGGGFGFDIGDTGFDPSPETDDVTIFPDNDITEEVEEDDDDPLTFEDLDIIPPDDLGDSGDTNLTGDDSVDEDAIAASVAALRRRFLSQGFAATNIHTGPQGLLGTAVNIRKHQLTGS